MRKGPRGSAFGAAPQTYNVTDVLPNDVDVVPKRCRTPVVSHKLKLCLVAFVFEHQLTNFADNALLRSRRWKK